MEKSAILADKSSTFTLDDYGLEVANVEAVLIAANEVMDVDAAVVEVIPEMTTTERRSKFLLDLGGPNECQE